MNYTYDPIKSSVKKDPPEGSATEVRMQAPTESQSHPFGEVRPPHGKLGVMIPGMGAVATTFVAGVEAWWRWIFSEVPCTKSRLDAKGEEALARRHPRPDPGDDADARQHGYLADVSV